MMKGPRGFRSSLVAGGFSSLAIAATIACLLPLPGCQAEYGSTTLPGGKYMHDDVQYFAPGPNFPFANTQAATQRARMQAQGTDAAQLPTANAADARTSGRPVGESGDRQ